VRRSTRVLLRERATDAGPRRVSRRPRASPAVRARAQRDTDRARAQKRNPKLTQNEKDGLTPTQRKERCVAAAGALAAAR
jgi:hypothetical protein